VDQHSDRSTVDSRWERVARSPELGLAAGSRCGLSPQLDGEVEKVLGVLSSVSTRRCGGCADPVVKRNNQWRAGLDGKAL
jgi:hypothetical protein